MKMRGRAIALHWIVAGVAYGSSSLAQPAPTEPRSPPLPPVEAPTEPGAPPVVVEAPPASARPEPVPLAGPAEAPGAVDPELDLPPPAHYAEGGDSWYDAIEFSAFIDAYASINYNFPKPQSGKNTLRAYDASNGFALSWVGVNASYPAEPVGGTLSLRFGPTANLLGRTCFAGTCDSDADLANVKQAFVSWKPGGVDSRFGFDFGKFDTIYGAEVPESQYNINYTRGFLYWLAQPSFHTGLRFTAELADAFELKALAVNGWNNSIDDNAGKTFGVQGTFHLTGAEGVDLLTASLGYLVGPEREDTATVTCGAGEAFDADSADGCVSSPGSSGDSGTVDRASANTKGLRHLIDLVVSADPVPSLHLVLNADFGLERVRTSPDANQFETAKYWGVMAGARLAVADRFGLGLRGEYLSDPDKLATAVATRDEVSLVSGTLTLDFLPADFLTLRVDNRIDWSNKELFDRKIRDKSGSQFTSTLGVVASTN